MHGHEHYREAERLAELASSPAGAAMTADGFDVTGLAQVHATLALAGATVEVSAAGHLGIYIGVPSPSQPELNGRPYPGTGWGRAFYGDRHLTSTDKDS